MPAATSADTIATVRAAVEQAAMGEALSPQVALGYLIRSAIDDVLDGPRTGRFDVSELSKEEKAFIGTRIEIRLRHFLGASRGSSSDAELGGVPFEIKWSKTTEWMLSPQNLGKLIFGLGLDKDGNTFNAGLWIARKEDLRQGENRDKKLSPTADTLRDKVNWVARHASLPANPLSRLSEDQWSAIRGAKSIQKRVDLLAIAFAELAVHRHTIETIAQASDPLRRMRRDKSKPSGTHVWLCSRFDRQTLLGLGLEPPPNDFWVPVAAEKVGGQDGS